MDPNISRRTLLTGAGLAGGAAIIGSTAPASAAPIVGNAAARPDGVPAGIVSISSPPEVGVSYRFAMYEDLTPLNSLADGRTFAVNGVWTATNDYVGATFDMPPGAVVHDVEAYCQASNNTTLHVSVWSSGLASLGVNEILAKQVGPFAGAMLNAVRFTVPKAVDGPYPHGCKLVVWMDTLTTQTIQVNGFRVGFKHAPLATVLLPAPARVYDSRKHSPISSGHARKVPLAAHVPVGTNAAQYVVSVLGTHGSGVLEAGPAGHAPSVSAVHWNRSGDKASASVTTPVSDTLAVEVRSAHGSGKTDFTVDLVGYLV